MCSTRPKENVNENQQPYRKPTPQRATSQPQLERNERSVSILSQRVSQLEKTVRSLTVITLRQNGVSIPDVATDALRGKKEVIQ